MRKRIALVVKMKDSIIICKEDTKGIMSLPTGMMNISESVVNAAARLLRVNFGKSISFNKSDITPDPLIEYTSKDDRTPVLLVEVNLTSDRLPKFVQDNVIQYNLFLEDIEAIPYLKTKLELRVYATTIRMDEDILDLQVPTNNSEKDLSDIVIPDSVKVIEGRTVCDRCSKIVHTSYATNSEGTTRYCEVCFKTYLKEM